MTDLPPMLLLVLLAALGGFVVWTRRPRPATAIPTTQRPQPPAPHARLSARDIVRSNIYNVAGDLMQPQPPRQTRFDLPARRTAFVGRVQLLDELATRLQQETLVTVTSLKGIAGVGKSTLALEAAHRFAHLFPDGRYWLDLRGGDVEQTLRSFLLALGVGNEEQLRGDFRTLTALLRDALAGQRALLVLDNADDLARHAPHQLRAMALPAPGRTLITSRVAIDPTHDLTVEMLSDDEALALLAARGVDVGAQRDDALALVHRLHGLALALDITARRMAIATPPQGCAQALAALDAAPSLVDALRLPRAAAVDDSAAASFALSYNLLDDELRTAFHSLGVCAATGVGVDEWAALLGLAPPAAHELAQALALLSLAVYDGRRSELHPLLHDYARSRAGDDPAAWQGWVMRHVQHFAGEIGGGYQRAVNDNNDYLPALARADRARENILLAQERALEPSFPDPRLALTVTDNLILYWRRRYIDLAQLMEWLAVAQRLAIKAKDRGREANVLQAQGDVLAFLDERAEALGKYEEALGLFRAVGDRLGEANVLKAQGDVLYFLKETAEALGKYEEALGLFRAVGDRLGEANVLKAQGDVLYFLKETAEALGKYEEALGLFRAVGARLGEANVLLTMGDFQRAAGDYDVAWRSYQEAETRYVAIGDRYSIARLLYRMGDWRTEQSQPADAILLYEAAIGHWTAIGLPDLVEQILRPRLEAAQRANEG